MVAGVMLFILITLIIIGTVTSSKDSGLVTIIDENGQVVEVGSEHNSENSEQSKDSVSDILTDSENEYDCGSIGLYLTADGCSSCSETFPNCIDCYAFEGTSDGTTLYDTPVYYYENDKTVKEYLGCNECNEGYEVAFWNQECKLIDDGSVDAEE
jgi:hypothetical protein